MRAISRKRPEWAGRCALYLFATVFLFVGSGLFIFLSAIPLWHWRAAQGWEEVPCAIQRSDVQSHSSDDGTTYSVDIEYTYAWNGQTYQGNQYNFISGSSSGRGRKSAIVAQFPAGSERVCFVNPSDPHAAVLNRDFSIGYLIGSFGLIFVTIALSIFLFSGRKRANQSISKRGQAIPRVPMATYSPGTVTLKGGRNSLTGFLFMLVFALFWNGIVGGAFWNLLSGSRSSFDLVPLLILIPFALIGLAMIGGAVYFFLSTFNPRPDITLSPGYLPLGGTSVLGWTFRGNTARIRRLTITLHGEEKATYRRGTSSTTDTSIFEQTVLFETETPGEIMHGELQFTVPEFSAPSFEAPNNKIVWQVKVHGDIRRWPDVREDFPLTVAPLPREAAGERLPAEFREG